MVGRSILTIIPPELHAEEPQIIQRLTRGERIAHYETVRLRKDGTRFDVSLSISPVRDSTGRVIGAAKILHDITAEKKAASGQRLFERSCGDADLDARLRYHCQSCRARRCPRLCRLVRR